MFWRRHPWVARSMIAAAILLCAPFLLKGAWLAAFWPDADALVRGESSTDLLYRYADVRDHLLAPDAPQDWAAPYVGPLFSGEWWLVSLSMASCAAVQLHRDGLLSDDEARADLDAFVAQVLRPEVRAFERLEWDDPLSDLDGPHPHIGYLGHLGIVLGARRHLGDTPGIVALDRIVRDTLVRRYEAAPFPMLETYPGQRYTADNTVALAAIALADRADQRPRRPLLDRWTAWVRRDLLDPASGTVVVGVDDQGRPVGRGRGSWAGWNSFYLPFIDEAFADEQWNATKRSFVTTNPVFSAVREFEDGTGDGDVDSGPILLGLSPSGTGFAIAGARRRGEAVLLGGLLVTAEGAGFSVQWDGRRQYLAAPLVGDAIVLAMKTAGPWDKVRR